MSRTSSNELKVMHVKRAFLRLDNSDGNEGLGLIFLPVCEDWTEAGLDLKKPPDTVASYRLTSFQMTSGRSQHSCCSCKMSDVT